MKIFKSDIPEVRDLCFQGRTCTQCMPIFRLVATGTILLMPMPIEYCSCNKGRWDFYVQYIRIV